jgi:predicted metal-binding membrane protein
MLAVSAGAWYWLLNPREGVEYCSLSAPGSDWHSPQEWARGLSGWFIMVLAMMLPLTVIPVRVAAFGSLWRRRNRVIGIFLAGYLSVWTVAGAVSLPLLARLRDTPATQLRWLIGAAFLLAAAWQTTALKRRFAAACHMTRPLAPEGWLANRDCLRFGAEHGTYCVGNCGVLMVAAMLSPWHRAMMVLSALLLLYERYRPRLRSRAVPLALGLLAIAHLLY